MATVTGTMTWKGIKPVVFLWEKVYEKGIRLTKQEMKPYENRIERYQHESVFKAKWQLV